jgi:Lrp/AsnC family transcriptional regulator, leucine-responsive regulatory protein
MLERALIATGNAVTVSIQWPRPPAGRRLVATIDVRIASPAEADRFEKLVSGQESVTDVAHVTGRFDYQVRAACREAADLDALIRTLKTKGGVIESDTRIALRTVVRRPAPLDTGA